MTSARNKKKTLHANERAATARAGQRDPQPLPRSNFLYNAWLKYSGEWAFSMMEPWEIIVCHIIMLTFVVALIAAIRAFLPSHLRIVSRRAKWYLFGDVSGLAPLDVPGPDGW